MKQVCIYFLLFFSYSLSLTAQDKPETLEISKWSVFSFHASYLKPDFEDFNASATSLNYKELNDYLIEYGFTVGSQTSKRKSSFGVNWVPRKSQGNVPQTQYSHLMIESSTLYSFLKKPNALVGINLGAGARWSKLSFSNADEVEILSQALTNDDQTFRNFGIPIWAGLESSFLVGKKEGGLLVGLGAGYRLDRVRKWKISDASTWKSRDVNLSGLYAMVTLGFYGKSSFKTDFDRDTQNTHL